MTKILFQVDSTINNYFTMERRDFIKSSLVAGAGLAVASSPLASMTSCAPCCKMDKGAQLNISFQKYTTPQQTLAEKFDYMESLGVFGYEPHGGDLLSQFNEIEQNLRGRNIKVSAICAGFSGFILSEEPEKKQLFDTTMREIIDAAGQIHSTGVIMVPAFNGQVPCRPHNQQTRDFLVEELKNLGEYALQRGTTVILEPLNRKECFFLRQVADAAAICRDVNSDGVKCMGDFWHMQEETSDFAAFISAEKYLQHVHIASRGTRNTPSEDGDLDNYVDGFRGLKAIGYKNYVSFECGTKGDKLQVIPAALELIRKQWEEA